jgi:site-specific DNA recombinase
MTKHSTLRAASYARVSSDKQAEEGTIASQSAALRERMVQDNLLIEEELCFADDGYTGTTLVRPALERLRDMAATGAFDRLYVHSPDRLARKYAYQVLLLDELHRCGVEVVFLNHDIGRTPEDQLLLQVQGMIAEYERAKLLERCRRGKLHMARQGQVSALAAAPFGYRYVRKEEGGGVARFDVAPEEARVVQQVFDWVGRERVSLGEVCRRLQEQGIRTKTGQERWDRSTICDMLKNSAYQGTAVYGRTRVGPRRPRLRAPRGQAEQPRQPVSIYAAEAPGISIAVPALVSKELFAVVAEQLEENRMRNRQSRRGARWLLQGLLVCKNCGYALYGLGTRHRLADGRMTEHAYYRCMGRNGSRFGGEPVCDNPQLPVADLDDGVWKDVCDLLRNPAKVRVEYESRLNRSKDTKTSLQEEHLAQQIQKLKQAITRLLDAYQDGLLTKSEFAPRLQASKDRLQRLENEARKEEEQKTQEEELRLALGGLEEFAHQIEKGLDQADWNKRREILRALVKRIEVGAEDVRIVYRVSPPPFVPSPGGGTFKHCGGLLEAALIDMAAAQGMIMSMPAHGMSVREPLREGREFSL